MKECGKAASFYPVLILWAKGFDKSLITPLEMCMSLAMCTECSKKNVASDLITDQFWNQIKTSFYAVGKAQPDRQGTEVRFDPIELWEAKFKKAREV